jgi:hypothetical protein
MGLIDQVITPLAGGCGLGDSVAAKYGGIAGLFKCVQRTQTQLHARKRGACHLDRDFVLFSRYVVVNTETRSFEGHFGHPHLVPVIDMLNGCPDGLQNVTVGSSFTTEKSIVAAARDLRAGQQLLASYGAQGSASMLARYATACTKSLLLCTMEYKFSVQPAESSAGMASFTSRCPLLPGLPFSHAIARSSSQDWYTEEWGSSTRKNSVRLDSPKRLGPAHHSVILPIVLLGYRHTYIPGIYFLNVVHLVRCCS